jgi:flagellar protein FliT
MDSQDVISLYEEVAAITQDMLRAAQDADWNQLSALESRCSRRIAALQTGETAVEMSRSARTRKAQILGRILEDDRRIRSITEPWMDRLAGLMDGHGRQPPHARGVDQSG